MLHCSSNGSPAYILDGETHTVTRAVEVSHAAFKDASFDEVFDLTGGVYIVLVIYTQNVCW